MPKTQRQRGEDEADVGPPCDVIGNEERWTSERAEMFTANDFWVPEDLRGRPDERVIDGEPEPAHRFALRPSGIDVFQAPGGGLLKEALDVGDGFGIGKGSFAEFDLKFLLQDTHQFDAVEGRKIQITLKMSGFGFGSGKFLQQIRNIFMTWGASSGRTKTRPYGCAVLRRLPI
jgi:hypothetical protein